MYRIAIALGKSAVFVRYNPDAFKIGDVTERVPKAKREALMLSVLQEYLQTTPTTFLTLVYICYTQPSRQMHMQARAYVTIQLFKTELDYETYVGSVYPYECGAAPAGTPWYTSM
jgi:3-hydroxy-3-methylglutaryl CoA synthase